MKTTLKYSLHMQKNPAHPDEPEKAYASLQLNGVLDINALAAHMADHNSIYTKGTIVGVITDMCHCIKEAITEGNAVTLGDLGRFTPSINSEGALATTDQDGNPVTAMEAFTEANIKQVNVNYELGAGLDFRRDDFDFEFTTSRKAQAAAKRAQKKGQSSADWSEPETSETPEEEGGE
ncbi:MAG: hypothetical protein IJ700_08095 [Bacteroidaceae bacterium]|nr:hypothetical protein [Bacteroidaceae bacterium]